MDDTPVDDIEVEDRVLAMRQEGASWLEIQRALGLTRQQVRYAYQRAKRVERRRERRS